MGGTLWCRSDTFICPLLIGVGENIGVHPAKEYIFTVFCCPVGAYFKGGLKPTNFIVSDYDRASHSTGAAKVGGNYAGEFASVNTLTNVILVTVFTLDPATHTKIEEVGSANFWYYKK